MQRGQPDGLLFCCRITYRGRGESLNERTDGEQDHQRCAATSPALLRTCRCLPAACRRAHAVQAAGELDRAASRPERYCIDAVAAHVEDKCRVHQDARPGFPPHLYVHTTNSSGGHPQRCPWQHRLLPSPSRALQECIFYSAQPGTATDSLRQQRGGLCDFSLGALWQPSPEAPVQ